MDMRESFSRLKKKLKHPLTRGKHKPDRTGTDAGGERVNATGSLPRPGPHIVVGGGDDREGSGANAVGGQFFSTDQPSQSDGGENIERVYSSPSTPSLVHGGKPDGT